MGYGTALLDEAVKKKKTQQEARRLSLLQTVFDALDSISADIFFEDAYVFGSVTKPFRFSDRSDIDVGFTGLSDRDFFRMMSYLSDRTGCDVDIAQLEGHRLTDRVKREGLRWRRTV